jgi:urea transporter
MLNQFIAFATAHTPAQQFVLWLCVCSPVAGLATYLLCVLCHFVGKALGIEEDPKWGPLYGFVGIMAGVVMAIPLANLFILAHCLWNICVTSMRDLSRKYSGSLTKH